ncbi:MAG TPA: hypothetical protein VG936_18250 [Lacunisphaera sp.]|nr:hypothetical protein [Lacunisphaera sp.]
MNKPPVIRSTSARFSHPVAGPFSLVTRPVVRKLTVHKNTTNSLLNTLCSHPLLVERTNQALPDEIQDQP